MGTIKAAATTLSWTAKPRRYIEQVLVFTSGNIQRQNLLLLANKILKQFFLLSEKGTILRALQLEGPIMVPDSRSQYLLLRTSRKDTSTVRRPATATWLMSCRSL